MIFGVVPRVGNSKTWLGQFRPRLGIPKPWLGQCRPRVRLRDSSVNVHNLESAAYGLGVYSLGVYSLERPIFGSRQPLTWDWESTVWESRVWESTGSVYRFWISPDSHLGLGVNSLGVYNVGVYNLGLPILDLASQSHVLKKKYRGSFS